MIFDSNAQNEPTANGVGLTPFLAAAEAEVAAVAAMPRYVPAENPNAPVVVSNLDLPPDPFALRIDRPTTDSRARCRKEP